MSPDGRWLLVHVMVGWARRDVHLLDRTTGWWRTLVEGVEATTHFEFAADGRSLVGVTTVDAPRGRVVRAPLDTAGDWETIVAEGDAVLSQVAVSRDELLVVATTRAIDTIRRYEHDGAALGTVDGIGHAVAVAGLTADRTTGVAFAVVDSFAAPTSLWRLDGDARRWIGTTGDGAVPDLSVSQVTYPSLDGTSIGLFLIHRSDVEPSPDVPAILNGYGGFAISETPVWSPQIAAWCAAGGLYAIAGLRGGLEEGEAWHHAGRRAKKQNVFDDFHAAADWLVDKRLASRVHLAVLGRSNGGLLVGVALTQRPDLCRAVWCGVPLLDMIRFPQFLIARLWTSEYGDPDIAEEFAWLHAYSPYHHVVDGTAYPATLFTTAEGDSRVDALHARKMAALVQASSAGQDERPVLLFQEGRAGHGVGKPVTKRADELADGLAFLAWQLGLEAA
jgi:prolyl oligopeptidase